MDDFPSPQARKEEKMAGAGAVDPQTVHTMAHCKGTLQIILSLDGFTGLLQVSKSSFLVVMQSPKEDGICSLFLRIQGSLFNILEGFLHICVSAKVPGKRFHHMRSQLDFP